MPRSGRPTAVIIGVGPGLGMSIAHRFGREGYATALISRTDTRHAGYRQSLASAGIMTESFVANVRNREQLLATLDEITVRFETIDVVYYGPGAGDVNTRPKPITDTRAADARHAMDWVYPAIDVVGRVLPGMRQRNTGGLLFASGLSAVRPCPSSARWPSARLPCATTR